MELPFAVAESSLESSQTILVKPGITGSFGNTCISNPGNPSGNSKSSRQLSQFYFHSNQNHDISIDQHSSVASSSSLVTAASHEEEQVVVVERDDNEAHENEVEGSNCSLITASSSSQQSCYIPTSVPLQTANLNNLQKAATADIEVANLSPAIYYPTFALLPTISTPLKTGGRENVVASNNPKERISVPATITPGPVARITDRPPLSNSPSSPVVTTSSTGAYTVASRVTSMFSQFTSRHIGVGATTMPTAPPKVPEHSKAMGILVSASTDVSKVKSKTILEKKGQRITASPTSTNSSSYEECDEDESSSGETNTSETIDFAYVNVTDEDEVDVWLDGSTVASYTGSSQHNRTSSKASGSIVDKKYDDDGSKSERQQKVDVLTILLSGSIQEKHNLLQTIEEESKNGTDQEQNPNSTVGSMVSLVEQANIASREAANAKKKGNLQLALQMHSEAAKLFHNAAKLVLGEHKHASLANSFLLLSQTQAKSAIDLKRVLKQQPKAIVSSTKPGNAGHTTSTVPQHAPLQYKDRLRATLRGALDTNNQREADISESMFLGKAATQLASTNVQHSQSAVPSASNIEVKNAFNSENAVSLGKNPVDEMMELERELRAMDMALEMGNSITSLNNTRINPSLRNSISSDGSFMVVPSGSNSYMSSSVIWGNAVTTPSSVQIPARNASNNYQPLGPRARANRVQSLGARQQTGSAQVQQLQQQNASQYQQLILPPPSSKSTSHAAQPQANGFHGGGGGLESSWWGNSSTSASQILSSSVISLVAAEGQGGNGGVVSNHNGSSNNTKQLLRLMDSMKTLGEENAALLREVEDAEAARNEARAVKEQMRQFKEEYAQKFASLKKYLDKFRNSNGEGMSNAVLTSEYLRSASVSEQIQRQEQLIRKLTADLKREKEESKKKDAALRKYESFYKEVKARSAQKAAQRQGNQVETSTNSATASSVGNTNNMAKPQIPKPALPVQYQQQQRIKQSK